MLNVEYKLKNAEPLMTEGQTVAYQQLPITAYTPVAYAATDKPKTKTTNKKDASVLTVANDQFTVEFDKADGFITRYDYAGKSLLGEGGMLKPNFWRAVTDNDMGAGMNRKAKVWNNPEMKLTSLTVEKGKKVEGADEKCPAVVIAKYDMPAVKATLTLTYAISADGSMKITEQMDATEGEKVPSMFRFGMLMQMPYGIDRSTFYGRGPIENYCDRKESQNVSIYSQTADEQFYPYIRPQENGTKSDLRWWRQTDANGFGLEVSNAGLFSASALHYNIEDLDDGDDKEQRHSPQVPKSKFTNLIIDMAQTGVGGVDSWSMNGFALSKYRVEYGDKEFTFVLKPLK